MEKQSDTGLQSGAQKAMAAANEAREIAKTTAKIAKGAAAGGVGAGVALAQDIVSNPGKWLRWLPIVLIVVIVLPILLVVMLPLIVFAGVIAVVQGVLSAIGNFFLSLPIIGSILSGIMGLFGGGTSDTPPMPPPPPPCIERRAENPFYVCEDYQCSCFGNHFDTAFLLHNLEYAHGIIGGEIEVAFSNLVSGIRTDFYSTRASPQHVLEIIDMSGNQIHFLDGTPMIDNIQFFHHTAAILGLYSATKYENSEAVDLQGGSLQAAMAGIGNTTALFETKTETLENIPYNCNCERSEGELCADVLRCGYVFWPPFDEDKWVYIEDRGWLPCDDADFWSSRWGRYIQSHEWTRIVSAGNYYILHVPITLTVHRVVLSSRGHEAFEEHFGITCCNDCNCQGAGGSACICGIATVGRQRCLRRFATEYTHNLMSLLTDTGMGGWFGILTEAGYVSGFYSPFPGMTWRISSPMGGRYHPISGVWHFHPGIDIPLPIGVPIRAVASGRVFTSGWSNTAGNWIRICHRYASHEDMVAGITHLPGYTTVYMHNNVNHVAVGEWVVAGQHIGDVGTTGSSTGPHLHLEIRFNDTPHNPVSYIGGPTA